MVGLPPELINKITGLVWGDNITTRQQLRDLQHSNAVQAERIISLREEVQRLEESLQKQRKEHR